MCRTLTILVFLFLALSCKELNLSDLPGGQKPDPVEGFRLTYYHTGLMTSFVSLYFTDENNGYLTGYHGDIYHTTDGCATWETQATPTILPLIDIYFISKEEGFAVGGECTCSTNNCTPRGAVMLHTKDGGKNWQQVGIPNTEKVILRSICFTTDSVGYAVGGATILTTHDRGNSWKETILTSLSGFMEDVEFADPATGLIACSAGIMLRTVDSGQHWTASTIFNGREMYSFSKVDNHTVFIVGDQFIGKTDDFGATWKGLPANPGSIWTMNFKSDQLGYAFGMGGYSGGDFGHYFGAMFYTTDGGATWTTNDKLYTEPFEHSYFPTPDVGYAVSGNLVMKVERK